MQTEKARFEAGCFWGDDETCRNGKGVSTTNVVHGGGTQYRSVIFYHSPEQEAAAGASKEKLEKGGRFNRPIVTRIEPAPKFWRAEDYHQRYLQKRGQSHCAI